MSTMKHTHGTWTANRQSRYTTYIQSVDGKHVATTVAPSSFGPNSPEEEQANARLIAEAPALLAALTGLLNATRKAHQVAQGANDEYADTDAHFVGEWIDEARATIARAEGRA